MMKQKPYLRYLCKCIRKGKTEITLTSIFRPFTQYLVEAPLAVITALSLLGHVMTSFAHLDLGDLRWGPSMDSHVGLGSSQGLAGPLSLIHSCIVLWSLLRSGPESYGHCWGPEHSGPERVSLYSVHSAFAQPYPVAPSLVLKKTLPQHHAVTTILHRCHGIGQVMSGV